MLLKVNGKKHRIDSGKSKDIVLSAVNNLYFNSFMKLYFSLQKSNIYKIILLDIGLNENNKHILKQTDVNVINFNKEFEALDKIIGCEYFNNIKTYAFKPYLLKNFHNKIDLDLKYNYNILYIDAGIYINKSLNDVFDIINREDIFCIDHSSEMKTGNIEYNNKYSFKFGDCMLANMLPPPVYKLLKKKYPINYEGLTNQYIKAGFFGYKFNGKYQYIINDMLRFYIDTKIGIIPLNIEEEKKLSQNIKNILLKTYDTYIFYNNNKNKSFYKYLEKYLDKKQDKKYYTTRWLSHRHEQTILSYLISSNKIKVHRSAEYLITSFQKCDFIKYIYFQAVFLLGRKEEIIDLEQINKEYIYNLSKMNISDKINDYFNTCYIIFNINKYNLNRKIFSKNDVLYHKYNEIIKKHNFDINYFTDKLFYNLLINWNNKSMSGHKKILIRKDEKHCVLHRNNIEEENILNLIPDNGKKLFIMGNGPSLKEIMDNTIYLNILKQNVTFGLNAAYKAYEKYSFYPTYFGCFDSIVCKHHSKEFEKLILNSPIKKFFFINIDQNKKPIFTDPKILNHPKFVNINFISRTSEEKKRVDVLSYSYSHFIDMLTTGTNVVQCGILEGHKKIYLLGCDCNYEEIIDGAKLEKNTLKMIKTPSKNNNYWIDDYQEEGDVFNIPNVKGCQMPAWKRLNDTIKHLGLNVKIFNCSPISKIEYFDRILFSNIDS